MKSSFYMSERFAVDIEILQIGLAVNVLQFSGLGSIHYSNAYTTFKTGFNPCLSGIFCELYLSIC